MVSYNWLFGTHFSEFNITCNSTLLYVPLSSLSSSSFLLPLSLIILVSVQNRPFYIKKPLFMRFDPCAKPSFLENQSHVQNRPFYIQSHVFMRKYALFNSSLLHGSYPLWHGFVIQTFAFFDKTFVVVCRICCF